MPTQLAPLLPALCALTLAVGALACSTPESNSRADAPAATEQSTSEPSSKEQPAPAHEAPDVPPEDAHRYTQLHIKMTIEVDGDVKSRPQIISMPGNPVSVSQNSGGERPIHMQLQMTPTFVGESIALAGSLEGKAGEDAELAQTIDALVAPGEPMALTLELDGMAYVIEMVVTTSEYQQENSALQ